MNAAIRVLTDKEQKAVSASTTFLGSGGGHGGGGVAAKA